MFVTGRAIAQVVGHPKDGNRWCTGCGSNMNRTGIGSDDQSRFGKQGNQLLQQQVEASTNLALSGESMTKVLLPWQRFYQEAVHKYLSGDYAGVYEATVTAEFERLLPDVPPWRV